VTQSWTPQSGATNPINEINFADNDNGWAAGPALDDLIGRDDSALQLHLLLLSRIACSSPVQP
jgi:hypothetical protein